MNVLIEKLHKNTHIVYTKKFVNKFKKVLINFYGYKTYMDLVVIPFLYQKTLMYIPLLSYSDRKHNEVNDLLELVKDNDYQIRTLNFEYKDFKKDDTVTMRVNTKNIEEICKHFSSRTRYFIRKGKRNNFKYKIGNNNKMIEHFYEVYSNTMYRHGTPVLDKRLFYALRDEFKDDIIFLNFYLDGNIVGGACGLVDKDILIWEWLGIDDNYKKRYLGYYMMYVEIKQGVKLRKKIIDLGRSGYLTGSYEFKKRFHTYPVKIDVYKPYEDDIYEKYQLASEIWKKLPKPLADTLGSKLSKYLKDL